MPETRISADDLYINIANELKKRATCLRGSHGAVIVDGNRGVIVGTGYNGAPVGLPHCVEIGCLMEDGHCVRTIHAEVNAVINSSNIRKATLYVTSHPCVRCSVVICQCDISRVVYDARNELYSTDIHLRETVRDMFNAAGVTLEQYR